MMSLMQEIENAVSTRIDAFLRELHLRYDLSEDDLRSVWEGIAGNHHYESTIQGGKKNKKKKQQPKKSTATTNKKKLSPWLQFSHDQRIKIKSTHPDLTFGEISKKISSEWKLLTAEEKKTYTSESLQATPASKKNDNDDDAELTDVENDETDLATGGGEDDNSGHENTTTFAEEKDHHPPQENNQDDAVVITEPSSSSSFKIYSKEELSSMKTKELKDVCSGLDLSKTGTKQVLVERILHCQLSLVQQQQTPKTYETQENNDDDDNDDQSYDAHSDIYDMSDDEYSV